MHNVPQLRALLKQFPDELVAIGVHSAKFPSEKLTANIREAILRLDIHHPVVNDAGFEIWNQYGVRAWPTVALIDPEGKLAGVQSGEIEAGEFAPIIQAMIDEFDREGLIDRRPLDLRPEAAAEPARPLSFPSRVLHGPGNRLFVADTGHHQIVEAELAPDGLSARVTRRFGSGQAAFKDGAPEEAALQGPHGMTLSGETLYVADTDNHAIRAIDLGSGRVRTVAGTGEKARGRPHPEGLPTTIPLRSPWAVLAFDDIVLIAMAGSHQIWALVSERQLGIFAGNGREALVDGPTTMASFNQPSDLALGMGHLLVADPEASAIRAIALTENPETLTLVGQGLFEFGDVDGTGPQVRLQHPTGIAFAADTVYIADSYNHKIKTLDPTTGQVQTLIGAGQAGQADGDFKQAGLAEPEGVEAWEQDGRRLLYIADTNNHLIRVADLDAGTLHTLQWQELATTRRAAPAPVTRLPEVTVGSGPAQITFALQLPAGYKLNLDAPSSVRLGEDGAQAQAAFGPDGLATLTLAAGGDREVPVEMSVYYCEQDQDSLCLIHNADAVLPVRVKQGNESPARITYRIENNS